MKSLFSLMISMVAFMGLLAGCGAPKQPAANSPATKAKDKEAKFAEALAKLSPEDRALAEAQKFCALENQSRLGGMGPPVKVMIEDQPVFLCCKGCEKGALETPQETLAKVAKLKQANK